MNTDKDFAPYQPSLDMKELGFDEECLAIHSFVDGELNFMYVNTFHSNDDVNEKSAAAPLYQQAFRWLYQKLDIEKGVMPLDTESQQLLLKELIDKVSSKHLLV
jgi:hypothetical protein